MLKFPQLIEDRLTERAKRAVYAASLPDGSSSLNLLYALAAEKGSLAKNILAHYPIRRLNLKNVHNLDMDQTMQQIIKRAAQKASEHDQPYIGTEHLLYALFNPPHADVKRVITGEKIARLKKDLDGFFSQHAPLPTQVNTRRQKYSRGRVTAIEAFCENLQDLAEQGKIDPIMGREKETARICQILLRRTKNNPLLIGDPGVGKTAIVHGLAQRINNGEVPPSLLGKKIFALNLNSLVAGTMFRGDFEIRMQEIMREASRDDIILFIDEIHNIVGAGSGIGALDAANILKPALSNGSLRCIGATTLDEYKKYFEKDRALERRFQPIMVEEENEEQTIKTLLNLKKVYEKHHGIIIDDEAVKQAVRLSARYIQDRFLPDKAIDLLDEAASMLKTSLAKTEETKELKRLDENKKFLTAKKEDAIAREEYRDAIFFKEKEAAAAQAINGFMRRSLRVSIKPVLRKEHIAEALSAMCGIPIEKDLYGVSDTKNIGQDLAREIIGQKEAIAEITRLLFRKNAGLAPEARPVGSFMFLGPSGVGKTALAKALAEKTSRTLIALNMAEYAEPHTISRLIGSPPGYVGYGEGGELTEKIRRSPYAVVLFDEIEKAHPQVHSILLSILEDGILQDSLGRKVSFRNAIIILTSNAYTDDEAGQEALGLIKSNGAAGHAEKYTDGIREMLRPEIINRIDRIIVFNKLRDNEIKDICRLFIKKLEGRLAGLSLNIGSEVINHVAEYARARGEGAREVRAAVEELIEYPLSERLIKNSGVKKIKLALKNNRVYAV